MGEASRLVWKPDTERDRSPSRKSMQLRDCVSAFLFLWHAADGFAPSRVSSGSWSSSQLSRRLLAPLSVTRTEEELREKLAQDNEDLSEVMYASSSALSAHEPGRDA